MKFIISPHAVDGHKHRYHDEEFSSIDDANERCKLYNRVANDGGKVRWKVRRKVEDAADANNWHDREIARFASGEYTALPWGSEFTRNLPPHHYPHISKKDPGMIAFTESEEKGRANIKTRMSAGKYATKFLLEPRVIDDVTMRSLAAKVTLATDEIEFGITQDKDKIVDIYINGPRSCMSKSPEFFGGIHPASVYAGPDLGLAYITNKHSGGYTCRSVVWPEKKIFGRVYGDGASYSEHLTSELKKLNYRPHDEGISRFSFAGARLPLIRHPKSKGIVCPYVDVVPRARKSGDFLVLDHGGNISTHSTTGFTASNERACVECGALVEHAGTSIEFGAVLHRHDHDVPMDGFYCRPCMDKYIEQCDFCGGWRRKSLFKANPKTGKRMCGSCFRSHFAECSLCKNTVAKGETVNVEGRPICGACRAKDPVIKCNGCSNTILTSSSEPFRQWRYCRSCYDEREVERVANEAVSNRIVEEYRAAHRHTGDVPTAQVGGGEVCYLEIFVER